MWHYACELCPTYSGSNFAKSRRIFIAPFLFLVLISLYVARYPSNDRKLHHHPHFTIKQISAITCSGSLFQRVLGSLITRLFANSLKIGVKKVRHKEQSGWPLIKRSDTCYWKSAKTGLSVGISRSRRPSILLLGCQLARKWYPAIDTVGNARVSFGGHRASRRRDASRATRRECRARSSRRTKLDPRLPGKLRATLFRALPSRDRVLRNSRGRNESLHACHREISLSKR